MLDLQVRSPLEIASISHCWPQPAGPFSGTPWSLAGCGLPFGHKVFPICQSHRLPTAFCRPPCRVENIHVCVVGPEVVTVENPESELLNLNQSLLASCAWLGLCSIMVVFTKHFWIRKKFQIFPSTPNSCCTPPGHRISLFQLDYVNTDPFQHLGHFRLGSHGFYIYSSLNCGHMDNKINTGIFSFGRGRGSNAYNNMATCYCLPLFDIPKKEKSTTWSTSVSNEHFPFVCHAYSTLSHSEVPGIALMYVALHSRIFVANKYNSGSSLLSLD